MAFSEEFVFSGLFNECVEKIDKGEAEGDGCAKTNMLLQLLLTTNN